MIVMTSMIELESIFVHLFDEYFNGETQVVSKSSAVTTADTSDKRQQQLDSTSSTSTLATTITADGNFDMITKFLNHLQREWSRFVTADKQAKDLYNVNFDQLYAFLKYNDNDAKEFVVPSFLPNDDPIASLNKAMMFLSTAISSIF
ncbi:hypothetical protein Tco_1274854 [Tanacetum coccineum]